MANNHCIFLSRNVVEPWLRWLFTIYTGKPVGPRFGQMLVKIQGPVARSMVSVINQRLIPWQRIGFDTA